MFDTDIATDTTGTNQDRAAIIEHPQGLLLVMADGAGGIAGGREAAERVIQAVEEAQVPETEFLNPLRWCYILSQADEELYQHPIAGETTAVVVALKNEGFVCGASVGDSGAFLVPEAGSLDELTAQQWRRPLIGSSIATPAPFGPMPLTGTLLLATDGLIKYASPKTIRQMVLTNPVEDATKALIESVRYPSGNLPDDVTVIISRLSALG